MGFVPPKIFLLEALGPCVRLQSDCISNRTDVRTKIKQTSCSATHRFKWQWSSLAEITIYDYLVAFLLSELLFSVCFVLARHTMLHVR